MAEILADGRVELSDGRVVMYASELTISDLLEILRARCFPEGPVGAAGIPTTPVGFPSFVSGGGAGSPGPAGTPGEDGPQGPQGPAGTPGFPLLAPDGTAFAPSYSFSGDTDIGLFRSGPDSLGFSGGSVEAFRVEPTGVTVFGKLTVTGAIDPTDILLSRSTALFFESNTGTTAPVSAVNSGRIRYNNTTARWEQSVQGGAYVALGVSFPLLAPDGTAAAPSYSFAADTDTGIFRVAADTVGFTAGGVLRLDIDTGDVNSTLIFSASSGTAAAPTYSFSTDPDVGVFLVAVDRLGLSAAGTSRLEISTTEIITTIPIRAATLSFTADTDTSFGSGTSFTTGGTIRLVFATGVSMEIREPVVVGVPQLTFAGDLNTGLRGTPTAGSERVFFVAGGVDSFGSSAADLLGRPGAAAAPTYSFITDTNTGIGLVNIPDLRAGGLARLNIRTQGIELGVDGTAALPSFTFVADTDTGFFRIAANRFGISIGGNTGVDITEVVADGDTTLNVRRNVGAVFTTVLVTQGASDSGGVGFRTLRVPN